VTERVRRNLFRHELRAEMGRAKGFAEIYFGMGCGRKWGDRKGSPKFISAWVAGGNGASERVRRNLFRHGVGVEMGRPKGFAEIYFGMGCGRKWGDRKGSPKFISAWVAGGNGVTERVRRNSFRHELLAEMGRAEGFAEIYFGMSCGRKWGERKGSPKFISA